MYTSRTRHALALAAIGAFAPHASAQLGASYCTPNPNSTGLPALLSATGSLDVAQNDLTVHARQLPPGSVGYVLVAQSRGFVANPGGSAGNLCLGAPVGRYSASVLVASALGAASMPVDLTQVPSPTGGFAVTAGDVLTFQFWHRDAASGGGATSNLTNGLEVTFFAGCAPPFGPYPGAEAPTQPGASALVHGDLDGDGDAELIVVSEGQPTVAVHWNLAGASLSGLQTVSVGITADASALGDLDLDGDLDLAVAALAGNVLSVLWSRCR